MPKLKTTPPAFMQRKLTPSVLGFAKKHLDSFLRGQKKANGGSLPPTIQLLPDYVSYLGEMDNAFRKVDPSSLATTYEGVYQIYDMIRKKTQRLEERTFSMASATPKLSPTKQREVL